MSSILASIPFQGGKGKEGVGGETGGRGSWRLTCKAVKQINVPTGELKLMIYEIEGIPAISRVNPHVPTPCIIPPRPCPPCTRSHHRLNNFPNTVSIYMRAQTSSLPFPLLSLRSNILCSPMRCNGCANFFRDLFFITIPAVSLHFPFRWTVARISISRHSNSTLFFSSRLLPIFYFSLSFYFFHKKINRGRRRISRKLLPSFLSPPRFFLFFPISLSSRDNDR